MFTFLPIRRSQLQHLRAAASVGLPDAAEQHCDSRTQTTGESIQGGGETEAGRPFSDVEQGLE